MPENSDKKSLEGENTQVIFVKRPESGPINPDEVFKIVKTPIPKEEDIPHEHVLVKVLYLSLDPESFNLRKQCVVGWRTKEGINRSNMYIVGIYAKYSQFNGQFVFEIIQLYKANLNEVMRGATVAEVIISKNPNFQPGDKVQGFHGWQAYAVANGKDLIKLNPPPGASLSDYLGLFGITGLTAYFGLLDIGKPVAGETVVVSGAAGATGSVVGQIAKIKGCRVIGTAGTQEKCEFLEKELGFDVALNYRDPDFAQKLKAATPNYINVFFDNVGGDILDLCLTRIATKARIVLCGAISQYNEKNRKGPAFYTALIINRAKMEGFIVMDYQDRWSEARHDLIEWFKEGKLKGREHVIKGLENAPDGLLQLFAGKNTGKMVVKVAEPSVMSSL
ncbi:872_t:CDS:10 [Paraglomus occultum]|uniref:872_t:CDS:1 n=1 Tax=Paraglomus occultum TaxID=144539 RepID=A0A9N8ZR60_9GLOM|nr:872_t:CDS:10 [Paraglomus occultum]